VRSPPARPCRLAPAPATLRPAAAPTEDDDPVRRPRPRLPARAGAAAAASALAAAALAWLGPEPPLQPVAGAGIAAFAVLLLPRLGWLLTAAGLLGWLAVAAPGVALLLALALAPVPALLARHGSAWSVPALAPLLGVAGLAGAWPAVAGQAARWPARAALGGLGGWWLALAETLTSGRLLTGPASGVLPRDAWEGSALHAARDAVWPLLSGGALALAVLWALAAMVLPVLVRGRSAALDLVGAAAWAATLAAATQALAEALLLDPPRGLVVGAVLAGVLVVAVRAARARP
jgi:hypothetical protein